ncbi:DUF3833 family protein [Donghicola sp.]|jgi:hypothetical protein|uniref:DUF3833 family protein n=1 Tax=Donghicola sp. TaxID=1929294 RepID=UPI0025E41871|nr:DUF3833 family protein [Donghicola sp.]MCT4578397.1 DUF3833 domain-containing protein [Donghicola sp.]
MTVLWIFLGFVISLIGFVIVKRKMSFSAQKPADYDGPLSFDVRKALSGPLLCEGVIYGPTGRVASRFCAEMEGRWDGNKGTLSEFFTYDSGSRQDREWQLVVSDDGTIAAEAEDLIGTGRGWQRGDAVQLNYRIRLMEDAGGHVLDVTDWMYLTPNGVIMNRSQFKKFGITVGELVATMRPKEVA